MSEPPNTEALLATVRLARNHLNDDERATFDPALDAIASELERLRKWETFTQEAIDHPFTEDGQELLRKRLAGIAKAVAEECEPGSREFCLAGIGEFALAYRSLRHDHDQGLARAEAAEAELETVRAERDEMKTTAYFQDFAQKILAAEAELERVRAERDAETQHHVRTAIALSRAVEALREIEVLPESRLDEVPRIVRLALAEIEE